MQKIHKHKTSNRQERHPQETDHKCDHGQGSLALTDKPNIDPVCGMETTNDKAKSVCHASTRYYFCSQKCLQKFNENPIQYS